MSFKFFACLRGQSADISSDHSNSLASILSRSIRRVEGVTAEPTALLALDVENVEFADQISENNGAFTRHVEPPSRRSVRSTGAAATPWICFCKADAQRPSMTARHPGRRRPMFAPWQFAIA
jgi:hypothetical protein